MAEGSSTYVLRADSNQYDSALGKSARSTDNLDKSQRRVGKSAKDTESRLDKLAAGFSRGRDKANLYAKGAIALGTALTVGLVASGAKSVDSLAKTSDKLGLATEKLAGLRHAAELTGVSSATMDTALEKLNVRMAEAATGTGLAVRSFDALGVSSAELVKLSPDKAMGVIADKLSKVENAAQKSKIAYDIFGRSGVGLINTLQGGSEGLEAFQAEAEAAGVAINRIDARKVEIANDAMFKVRQQFTGFSQHLAVKFAPVLSGISERLFGVGKEAGGMASLATKAFNAMVKGAGILANGVRVLNIGWHLMKGAFQGAAKFIVSGLDQLVRAAQEMYNALPWVDDIEVKSMFSGFLATMESEIAESRFKVDELLLRRLPSEAFEEFVFDTTVAFEDQARDVQAAQESVQGALIGTEEVTESLSTKTKKSAKEVESAWDKAITGTVERVDSAFADAWKGSFDSFSDFASGLKDAFKDLLAEMAHLAITRPVVVGITGALGIGGGGALSGGDGVGSLLGGGGSSGGGGSLLSTASSLVRGGFGGLGDTYQAAGRYLSDLGFAGAGDAASNVGVAYNTNGIGANFANAGLNIGAGIVGSFAGNAVGGLVSDKEAQSSIGATVGGAVGSIWGPVGTFVGSALGGLVDTLTGSSGKISDEGARAKLDLSSNTLQTLGREKGDKKFSQENYDSVQRAAAAFRDFSSTVGGSDLNFDIIQGNRRGVRLNGEEFADMASAVSSGLDDILASASNLDPVLKSVLEGFGSANPDDLLRFSNAVVSISSATGANAAAQAVEDYARAQEASTLTLMQAYTSQNDALLELVGNYDGSVASAEELNGVLLSNKSAAYEFALGIQAIGDQIASTAATNAQYFRESVMTDQELRQSRREERNQLRASLKNLTDPQEIAEANARLSQLQRQIFDSLSEDLQLKRAETFVDFGNEVAAITQRQLDKTEAMLLSREDATNASFNALFQDLAAKQREAADTNLSAAQSMAGSVGALGAYFQQLITNGIPIVSTSAGAVNR